MLVQRFIKMLKLISKTFPPERRRRRLGSRNIVVKVKFSLKKDRLLQLGRQSKTFNMFLREVLEIPF